MQMKSAELSIWMTLPILKQWKEQSDIFRKPSAAVSTRAVYSRSAMELWTIPGMQNTA